MKYFKNPQSEEVFGYDETYPNDEPLIAAAIEAGWEDVSASWPPPPPPPPPPLTPEQKLTAAGLTVDELKSLLGIN